MKVAVIGSGPDAAAASIKFDDLGADVRVFAKSDWCKTRISATVFNQLSERSIKLVRCETKRIHKAHLAKNAPGFGGKSRLSDMFRIVISENPSDGILKQQKENPEVFQKLGEQILSSLSEPVENFHDVDIVVATFDELSCQPGLSPSGAQVLNESRAKSFIYDQKNLPQDNQKLQGKTLVVGGLDEVLAVVAKQSHEVIQLKIFGEQSLSKEWFSFLEKSNEVWEQDKNVFQHKIHEWRELEDYVRVKFPMPVEPSNSVQVFDEATLISLDCLVDQKGIFATIELTPDGNITTLKFDQIFNARIPIWDLSKFSGLAIDEKKLHQAVIKEEPGFYLLNHKVDLTKTLELIIEDVMNWFKPVSCE